MRPLKTLSEAYQQLPLHWKINLPFISTCLGIWTLGTFSIAYVLSDYLEHRQQENLNTASTFVLEEFENKLDNLQKTAELISTQPSLQTALATADTQKWQEELIPLKPILDADIIQVLKADGSTLLSVRQSVVQDTSLNIDSIRQDLLNGQSTSRLVDANDALFSTLVSTAIINDGSNDLGGVLIGFAITDQELQKLVKQADIELVAFDGEQQIASTFSQRGERFSVDQFSLKISRISVSDSPYAAKSIAFDQLNETTLTLALLHPLEPLRRLQRTLWLIAFVTTAFGAVVVVAAGQWTARKITRPIKAVTQTAQQVVQNSDFNVLADVTTQDEVGTLAAAFNQLVVWMGEYTEALQESQAKLNEEIKERSQTLNQLKSTQSQLIQAEKMSSLGQMVAGVAHEINNPVNFIHGNISHVKRYAQDLFDLLDLYQEKYPEPDMDIEEAVEDIDLPFLKEDFFQMLTSMKTGTERAREIVLSLRNFARLDEAELKYVDLQEGIDSTLLILKHRIKGNIKVITEYNHTELVNCYSAQLNQVFMNILSNALDALENSQSDCSEIVVRTEEVESKVIVSIKDNGSGIPDEVVAKIFDPFFTTKAIGKGTGLGLSICYQIVQKHRGTLSVRSNSPRGTEFLISLPLDI